MKLPIIKHKDSIFPTDQSKRLLKDLGSEIKKKINKKKHKVIINEPTRNPENILTLVNVATILRYNFLSLCPENVDKYKMEIVFFFFNE